MLGWWEGIGPPEPALSEGEMRLFGRFCLKIGDRMHRVLLLSAALASISCGGNPGAQDDWQGAIDTIDGRPIVQNPPVGVWRGSERGHLVEDLRIGALEGGGPEMFGSIAAIAVSSIGDIAVLESQTQEVRIFDRGGDHVRTVGRRGEGPGEFKNAISIHYDGGDRLWVVDLGNARYSVFSPTGELLRSSPRFAGVVYGDPGMFTDLGLLDPTGRVTPEGEVQRFYVLVDSAGAIADTLPPMRLGHMSTLQNVPARLAPFMPRVISTPETGGDVWIASTDRYVLFRLAPAGDTLLEVRLETPPLELSPEDRDSLESIVSGWPASVDQEGLDLGAQYLRSLHADELGRVFVRPNLPEGEADRVFDMFDEEGRYLGRIQADVSMEARPKVLFRNNAAYGVTLDSFDVPYLVRARLELPP